jgi:hypothetical protein
MLLLGMRIIGIYKNIFLFQDKQVNLLNLMMKNFISKNNLWWRKIKKRKLVIIEHRIKNIKDIKCLDVQYIQINLNKNLRDYYKIYK